jgi:hypothetical protein
MRATRRISTAVVGAGVAVALAAGPAVAAEAAPNTGTTDQGCDAGAWPATAQGRPTSLRAGSPTFGFAWHEGDGWRLLVTHDSTQRKVFLGHVRADAAIAFREVRDEHRDIVRMDGDHKGFTFSFTNYGHIDGVHFRTDCATRLVISLSAKGEPVPTRRIVLGHDNTHPTSNPIVLTRPGATATSTTSAT